MRQYTMNGEWQLKKTIIEIGRRIWTRGYVAANDGNITVKISDKERTLHDFDMFDKKIRNNTGMDILYVFSSKKNFRVCIPNRLADINSAGNRKT